MLKVTIKNVCPITKSESYLEAQTLRSSVPENFGKTGAGWWNFTLLSYSIDYSIQWFKGNTLFEFKGKYLQISSISLIFSQRKAENDQMPFPY